MNIEKLVPEQEFEYEGVMLKAVETVLFGIGCEECFFKDVSCGNIPCTINADLNPEQRHELYFIKSPN